MRVAVAGLGRLGGTVLNALLHSNHTVAALILNGRKTRGLSRNTSSARAWVLPLPQDPHRQALLNRIPIYWLDKMTPDALAPLRSLEPDLIITCGFSIIFKPLLINLPKIGCINLHSSLLPKHRGPMPFPHVILAGEEKTGVTYHIMNEGIDTGDIIDQFEFDMLERDTALTVYYRACEVAEDTVADVIDKIEAEGLQGIPQDPQAASYDKRLEKQEMLVDWTRPALDIDRLIRAGIPFEYAWFNHRGHNIRIAKALHDPASIPEQPGTILAIDPAVRIATGQGSITIQGAFTSKPVPWSWPAPWSRAQVGEQLT